MKMTRLFAPASYWQATQEEHDLVCNGCGAKGLGGMLGFLVPDTFYGLSITRACNIHDWMYTEGKGIEDKDKADRAFLNNLLRIIEAESCWLLKPLRRYRAMTYYGSVRDFGGPAFWAGKNEPREMRNYA